ncbi:cob(I)yrinic acid a,c-diamide adenosyltransferase [Vibrio sp. DW001]|uniref:cob(I)yrinic acid a,c-diamide adenosyltransferase n=1 Tax=Vibrio sp. DW001 TaxID=2912315 RepID=UPI0023B1E159|nr:cob(I)yrinic acid a,c-diamide adenosyltransferase [Vibrio sp. DW001]WED28694.1 cob(I)yrinic acid a,c-diamide adenosyltransferase [Vibrio sp. DW001]
MSIYTKKGDAGMTSLVGGTRVNKSDLQVDAYGTIDELNSNIALATKAVKNKSHIQLLESIQHQLFYLGAEVATSDQSVIKSNQRLIETCDIESMERAIDQCMSALPPVNSFVLPGSSEAGSRLHCARTIARRAERRLVEVAQHSNIRPIVLKYVNRLSDFLYALARAEDDFYSNEQMIKTIVHSYCEAVESGPKHDNQHSQIYQERSIMPTPQNLNFMLVHQMIKQAVDTSIERKVPVVISVVDANGHLIITYRMPEALLVSTDLAPKKAYTSVALKCATHQLSDLIQPGTDLYQLETMCDGKIVTFGGGIPLYQQQQLVGAIGISGGTVKQDVEIALAAIKNLDLEEK